MPDTTNRFDADPTICPSCDYEKHPLETHCEVCRDDAEQLERGKDPAEGMPDECCGLDCYAAGAGF